MAPAQGWHAQIEKCKHLAQCYVQNHCFLEASQGWELMGAMGGILFETVAWPIYTYIYIYVFIDIHLCLSKVWLFRFAWLSWFIGGSNNHFDNLQFKVSIETSYIAIRAAEQSLRFYISLKCRFWNAGCKTRTWMISSMRRKGTNGVSTNWGHCNTFVVWQRDFLGTPVNLLFIFPKVPARTFFPNLSKSITFAAAPLEFTQFVRNQNVCEWPCRCYVRLVEKCISLEQQFELPGFPCSTPMLPYSHVYRTSFVLPRQFPPPPHNCPFSTLTTG